MNVSAEFLLQNVTSYAERLAKMKKKEYNIKNIILGYYTRLKKWKVNLCKKNITL